MKMEVKDKSKNFEDVFRRQFASGREGPNLDFKEKPYELALPTQQFEFAKDIIAFANVARRTNQKCYVLFGIREKKPDPENPGKFKPCHDRVDVGDFHPRSKPQNWDDTSIHDRQVVVLDLFYEVAKQWVDPNPAFLFELKYGEIDGIFNSYLEIKPTRPSKAYCLKKSLDKLNSPYCVGAVLIRKGASNACLEPSEVPYLFQWNQAAYFEQEEWQQIIRAHLTGEFEKMQILSPPFHPRTKSSNLSAFDAVMQVLNAGKRLMVIKGEAGGGKTVLLHRIAYALANQHNLDVVVRWEHFGQVGEAEVKTETVASVGDELEVTPFSPVPIFMTLRESFETRQNFERHLLAQILEWTGKDELDSLGQLFSIPGSKWVILLDGVDEIRNSREFAPQLRSWIKELPRNVQVVVTYRTAFAEFDLPEKATVEIESLTQEDALYLLRGNLPSVGKFESTTEWEAMKQDVENWLHQQPDLLKMLTCPRALFGLIQFLNPTELTAQTQRDQDRVEISEMPKPTFQSVGTGDIPSLDVDLNKEQSDLPPDKQENEKDKWIPPQLALALQAITVHMRNEEIKRRDDWGQKARQTAQQAQMELDETAWRSDWDADGFDWKKCERNNWITRESCEWNKDIGFIRDKDPRRYKFICDLLHYYFCVEYAYDFEVNEEEIKETMVRRGINRPATQSVLNLLNQIRLENKRDLLNFT